MLTFSERQLKRNAASDSFAGVLPPPPPMTVKGLLSLFDSYSVERSKKHEQRVRGMINNGFLALNHASCDYVVELVIIWNFNNSISLLIPVSS